MSTSDDCQKTRFKADTRYSTDYCRFLGLCHRSSNNLWKNCRPST